MNPSQANPLKGHDKIPSNVESKTKRGIEVELKVPIKQDEGIFDRANEESSMKILLLPLQWIDPIGSVGVAKQNAQIMDN